MTDTIHPERHTRKMKAGWLTFWGLVWYLCQIFLNPTQGKYGTHRGIPKNIKSRLCEKRVRIDFIKGDCYNNHVSVG